MGCSCWLCENCWPAYPPHSGGRRGRDGLEHEKTHYHVVKKLEDILTSCPTPAAIEEFHSRDLDTTWFGMSRSLALRPATICVYSSLTVRQASEETTMTVVFLPTMIPTQP